MLCKLAECTRLPKGILVIVVFNETNGCYVVTYKRSSGVSLVCSCSEMVCVSYYSPFYTKCVRVQYYNTVGIYFESRSAKYV